MTNKISFLPDIHRLLPQSPEAEQGVLASLLLAPVETHSLCASIGMTADAFHIPAHATVFRAIDTLIAGGKPVEFITLNQHLRDLGALDAVGGAGFLSSLYTFLPTAANAKHYIEDVMEKATARGIIADATEIAARAYDGTEQPSHLADELVERVGKRARKGSRPIGAKMRDAMFRPDRKREGAIPIYGIGPTPVLFVGDILCVEAQVKSGKTAFVSAAIAASIADPTADCLGWHVRNPEGHAIIHLDTEQSGDDHDMLNERIVARAGIEKEQYPGWLQSYCVTGFTLVELRECVRIALDLGKRVCGGVHSLVIDGIADFVPDVNDPVASQELIAWLMSVAAEHRIGIITVLHLNPISSKSQIAKARGHLGSQLYRKAAHVLRIEKGEDGVSNVTSVHSRKQPVPKDYAPAFVWSDDKKRHVSAQNNAFEIAEKTRAQLREIISDFFTPLRESARHGELCKHVQHRESVGERTARDRITEMLALGVVSKDRHGIYTLAK